jgi:hypothetical protein
LLDKARVFAWQFFLKAVEAQRSSGSFLVKGVYKNKL